MILDSFAFSFLCFGAYISFSKVLRSTFSLKRGFRKSFENTDLVFEKELPKGKMLKKLNFHLNNLITGKCKKAGESSTARGSKEERNEVL